jgi:surface antigen
MVRKTVSTVPVDQQQTVEWNNPGTGSNGAVTVAEVPGQVALCRPFSTTVSDPHGVRRYRGQACRETDGRWQLQGISADDARLS